MPVAKEKAPLIYQKISAIMEEAPAVGKDRKNKQQGYTFRGIDDMYNSLHDIFAKHQVFISTKIINELREERTTKSGSVLIYSILDIEYTFFTTDGSSVTSVIRGEGMDSGDKSSNKAMSSALKYALMQLLLLPTEDGKKNDSENHHHEVEPKKVNSFKLGVFTEDIAKEIDQATSRKALESIYHSNMDLHENDDFIQYIQKRSIEIEKPKKRDQADDEKQVIKARFMKDVRTVRDKGTLELAFNLLDDSLKTDPDILKAMETETKRIESKGTDRDPKKDQ